MNLLAGLGSVGRGISQGAEDWRRQDEADARKKAAQRDETTFNNQQDELKRKVSLRDALSKPGADAAAIYDAHGMPNEAMQHRASQRANESGKLTLAEQQQAAEEKKKMLGIYADRDVVMTPIDENDQEAVMRRAAALQRIIDGGGKVMTELGGSFKGFTYHGITPKGKAIYSNPNGDRGEVAITPEVVERATQLRIDAADPIAAHARAAAIAAKTAEKKLETQSKIEQAKGTGEEAKNLADARLKDAYSENINAGKKKDGTSGSSESKAIQTARWQIEQLQKSVNPATGKPFSEGEATSLVLKAGQGDITAKDRLRYLGVLNSKGYGEDAAGQLENDVSIARGQHRPSTPANRPPITSFQK